MATAAQKLGGFVIVQVERVAEYGTLSARQIKIPGILVDCVVVSTGEPLATFGDPTTRHAARDQDAPALYPAMSMGDRKSLPAGPVLELSPNHIVNLGYRYA
jgi:propionate CoA-transferase